MQVPTPWNYWKFGLVSQYFAQFFFRTQSEFPSLISVEARTQSSYFTSKTTKLLLFQQVRQFVFKGNEVYELNFSSNKNHDDRDRLVTDIFNMKEEQLRDFPFHPDVPFINLSVNPNNVEFDGLLAVKGRPILNPNEEIFRVSGRRRLQIWQGRTCSRCLQAKPLKDFSARQQELGADREVHCNQCKNYWFCHAEGCSHQPTPWQRRENFPNKNYVTKESACCKVCKPKTSPLKNE
jgi:hypothetical protein